MSQSSLSCKQNSFINNVFDASSYVGILYDRFRQKVHTMTNLIEIQKNFLQNHRLYIFNHCNSRPLSFSRMFFDCPKLLLFLRNGNQIRGNCQKLHSCKNLPDKESFFFSNLFPYFLNHGLNDGYFLC